MNVRTLLCRGPLSLFYLTWITSLSSAFQLLLVHFTDIDRGILTILFTVGSILCGSCLMSIRQHVGLPSQTRLVSQCSQKHVPSCTVFNVGHWLMLTTKFYIRIISYYSDIVLGGSHAIRTFKRPYKPLTNCTASSWPEKLSINSKTFLFLSRILLLSYRKYSSHISLVIYLDLLNRYIIYRFLRLTLLKDRGFSDLLIT
jgi:hypothetical protein